jgi:hypothetical protein
MAVWPSSQVSQQAAPEGAFVWAAFRLIREFFCLLGLPAKKIVPSSLAAKVLTLVVTG